MTHDTLRSDDRLDAMPRPVGRTGRPPAPGPRRVATAATAFAATLALLGLSGRGPAPASADDPAQNSADPAAVVQEFQPAVADGQVAPAGPVDLGGATVKARLVRADDGTASILVVLQGPRRGKADVHCRVTLKLVEFPDASPMMRLLPEPTITELVSAAVNESVGAGETRTVAVPVPADRVARLARSAENPMTHGQLTLEAADAP